MRILFFILLLFFSSLCEAKKTVLLDIDDTLCWHTYDAQLANAVSEKYPDLIKIDSLESHPGTYYFFIPHVEMFLRFLIFKDFDIYFYSAGSEVRNGELIERLLPEIFEEEECDELIDAGQFKYFSGHYMISALCGDEIINEATVENTTNFKTFPFNFIRNSNAKSLRTVLPDVGLNDMILIDDSVLNGISYDIVTEKKYFQTNSNGEEYQCFPNTEGAAEVVKQFVVEDRAELPMIQPAAHPEFLSKLVEDEVEPIIDFILKSAIYYAGVLSTALDIMEDTGVSLREGVKRALHYNATVDVIDIDEAAPFDLEQNPGRDIFLARGDTEIAEIIDMFIVGEDDSDDDDDDKNIATNGLDMLARAAEGL